MQGTNEAFSNGELALVDSRARFVEMAAVLVAVWLAHCRIFLRRHAMNAVCALCSLLSERKFAIKRVIKPD